MPAKPKPAVVVRKPPPPKPPDSRTAESFIATGAPVAKGPGASGDKGTSAPKGRGIVQRVHKGARRRVALYLPPDVAQRLVIHCATQGVSMSDVAADAFDRYLKAR